MDAAGPGKEGEGGRTGAVEVKPLGVRLSRAAMCAASVATNCYAGLDIAYNHPTLRDQ